MSVCNFQAFQCILILFVPRFHWQNVSQYHAAIDGAGQKLTEKTERLSLVDRDLVQRADQHAQDLDNQANRLEE